MRRIATYLENLTTARANIAERLAEITADPKPTYSLNGQSVSWESYVSMLIEKLERMDQAIQRASGPYQKYHRGRV